MSVVLSYDDVLSRVIIAVTGLSASASSVTVERSTNQVTWSTVRGGSGLIPVSNAVTVADYEFNANVLNYYRVSAYDTSASAYVTGGAPSTGNNTSLSPAMPAGIQSGDVVFVLASIRNTTGVPNIPTGYTLLVDAGNQRLFGRVVTGAEAAPTVTFTGGVANADTLAQTAAFRRLSLDIGSQVTVANVSAQNIATPPLVVPDDRMTVIRALWKQDDWTAITAGVAGFAAIMGNGAVSTAGDDAAQSWSYVVQTTAANIAASTANATGGAAALSRASLVSFYHADLLLTTEIASITPELDTIWFKVIAKPFLNQTVYCVPKPGDVTRRARQGVFPIIGRSLPTAVTDVRGSREYELDVITRTTEEYQDFDLMLSTGDIIFVHTPPTSPIQTAYVAIDDVVRRQPLTGSRCGNDWRVFTLPVIEVTAPGADVVGSVGTWQTVVNTYATWADVIANHPTWADLLTLVGSADDVIVP